MLEVRLARRMTVAFRKTVSNTVLIAVEVNEEGEGITLLANKAIC